MIMAGTVRVAAGATVAWVTAAVVGTGVVLPVTCADVVAVAIVVAAVVVIVAVVGVVAAVVVAAGIDVVVVAVVVTGVPSTVTRIVPADGVMTASVSSFIWISDMVSMAVPPLTPFRVMVPRRISDDPFWTCLPMSTALMRYPVFTGVFMFMEDAHDGNAAPTTVTRDDGYPTVSL